MLISRSSIISGKTHTLDIDITQEELEHYETGSEVIQKVFPHLSADEREFLMTGITGEEWDNWISNTYTPCGDEEAYEDQD